MLSNPSVKDSLRTVAALDTQRRKFICDSKLLKRCTSFYFGLVISEYGIYDIFWNIKQFKGGNIELCDIFRHEPTDSFKKFDVLKRLVTSTSRKVPSGRDFL